MATDLQNLIARRSAITAQLASMSLSTPGGLPNVTGGGGVSVDHVGYRKSLIDEMKELQHLIRIAEGPWEQETIAP